MAGLYEFFNRLLNVSAGKQSNGSTGNADIRIEGTKGWIGNRGWRGKLEASENKILEMKFGRDISKHWRIPPYEHRNFLDCFKSRATTTYPAETMHRLHVTLHLGIIAIRLGRKLRWDQGEEAFVNDKDANEMRSRISRTEWM